MRQKRSPSASAFPSHRLPLVIAALCTALALCPSLAAAAERNTKVGVVDTRKVLERLLSWQDTLKQVAVAEAKLKEIVQKEMKDIRRIEAELRYLKPDSDDYAKRKTAVTARLRRLDQRRAELAGNIARQSSTAAAQVRSAIAKAVADYAAANGFDLVVDARAVLYAVDGLDISQKVALEMNKRYKGRKAAKNAAPRKDK
jgi:Skp family chaperone for outer membrane proteins